jgi:hypothetical protein
LCHFLHYHASSSSYREVGGGGGAVRGVERREPWRVDEHAQHDSGKRDDEPHEARPGLSRLEDGHVFHAAGRRLGSSAWFDLDEEWCSLALGGCGCVVALGDN